MQLRVERVVQLGQRSAFLDNVWPERLLTQDVASPFGPRVLEPYLSRHETLERICIERRNLTMLVTHS